MIVSALGILILGPICAWVFGGIALRFAGGLLALAGMLGLSLSGNATGLTVFALGACLWIAGHLHFRLRHRAFKSAFAEWVCLVAASVWRRAFKIGRHS